jgi:hypothetical protein
MKRSILTLSASLLMINSFATVYFVKPAATGSGAGNTWANAATVQNATQWSSMGDTIWMAAGTYKASSANATIISLTGKELAFFGGFNGTETSLSQANWQTNVTILDGDFSGNDNSNMQLNEPTRSDNSYMLVSFTGDTMVMANLYMQGLVFRNANNALTGYQGIGGAVRVYSSDYDTVMYRTEGQFVDCTFEHNVAASGGAIGIFNGLFNTNATALADRCSFVENYGRGSYGGGAVSCLSVNVYQMAPATVVITNSLFAGNSSDQSGGAIGAGTSSLGGRTYAVITNNTFYDNVSVTAPATLDCTNYADSSLVPGIGYLHGGADLTFRNNIVNRPSTSIVPFELRSKNMAAGNFSSYISDNILDLTNAVYQGTTVNNLAVDPLFVNAGNGDFRLTACSPAVNAGDTVGLYIAGYSSAMTDLDIMGRYNADTIDMGAYEYAIDLNVTSSGYTLNAATTAGYTYQWYNCDNGLMISGATSASYTAPLPGNYACVINDNGCVADTTTCMPVALSVANVSTVQAEIYPNPVVEQLNIFFATPTNAMVTLSAIDGRVLAKQQVRGVKASINVSSLPAGVIILTIIDENGGITARRMLKQ